MLTSAIMIDEDLREAVDEDERAELLAQWRASAASDD
jgi:hypothetical protein